MTKQEKGRIELVDKIKNDTNTLEVRDITQAFLEIFFGYFEISKSGSAIKKKLTEEEYVRYVTGFVNSFLSTIYVSASKDEKELKQRMEYVKKINKDVLIESKIINDEPGKMN